MVLELVLIAKHIHKRKCKRNHTRREGIEHTKEKLVSISISKYTKKHIDELELLIVLSIFFVFSAIFSLPDTFLHFPVTFAVVLYLVQTVNATTATERCCCVCAGLLDRWMQFTYLILGWLLLLSSSLSSRLKIVSLFLWHRPFIPCRARAALVCNSFVLFISTKFTLFQTDFSFVFFFFSILVPDFSFPS